MKKIGLSRALHFITLLSALFVLVFVMPTDAQIRQRVQFLTFDYYLKNYERIPVEKIKIIDINDESLAKLGQWPWPRTYMARIVDKLTEMGVRAIAFDGVLAEPDRTSPALWSSYTDLPELKEAIKNINAPLQDNDKALAESIKRSGRFVAGFSFGSNDKPPRIAQQILARPAVKQEFLKTAENFKTSALFLPELESVSAGNGSFMANAETDGVIRRTSLIFSNGQNLFPSLVVEALRVSFDQRPIIKLGDNKRFSENKIDTEYRLFIDKYEIPIERDGSMWIYFRKMDRDKDYIPAYKFFDEKYFDEIKDEIKGRIVFVGSSAEGLLDLRSTPFGLLPGVEIHANALEQILQGKYLIRPRIVKDAENNYILMVGLFLIILAPFIGASWLAFICFALSGAVFYLSNLLFIRHGILLDPIYPVISVLVIYVFSSILTYIRTESERRQVKQAFGLYISPDFMKELTKDPDKLKLGGETRELTVMFTDIRSFTTISESLTPEALIQLMNGFLTPMTDLVMENRGTIDKYMGDAMMAFWNAPLDDPDHARHACVAALKMNRALDPINEELFKQGHKAGRPPLMLKAGIGINTGPASVGNMGSKQRFTYSAIGDAVNLASRLEGQTKNYGASTLIGPTTQARVTDFATLEMDLIRVKGKMEPVRIYSLIGDNEYAQQPFFAPWRAAHEEMIAAYRAADFTDAEKLIEKCGSLAGGRLMEFYQMFGQRIADLKKTPPGKGWDGVFIATSK